MYSREQFEAEYSGGGNPQWGGVHPAHAWAIWQASREALVVELPDPWDHLNPQSYGEDIKDALDKAGIKWK